MQFSEHEMTVAVTAAAKHLQAATERAADPETAWSSLNPRERYDVLNAVGDIVLPALVALPEVEVSLGTRPTFTAAQLSAAVEQTLGEDGGGWLRRKATIAARTSLLSVAVAQLPTREDPDTFVVPDHL